MDKFMQDHAIPICLPKYLLEYLPFLHAFEQVCCCRRLLSNRKALGPILSKDRFNICQFRSVESGDPVSDRNSIVDGAQSTSTPSRI